MQLKPLNSTSIEIVRTASPTGNHKQDGKYTVRLAGNNVGSFEVRLVQNLVDRQQNTAFALGLTVADECYLCNSQIFSTQEQVAAQVIGDYLQSTAVWKISDCN
jgi:hypothetical protein